MDSDFIPLIIFAVIVPIFWSVATYNRFVKYKNMIEEAWSGIDIALKRRFNLIPNLIKTVKLYSQHETNTLEQVTTQRVGSEIIADRAVEESEISQNLQNVLAVAEAYPDLKASQNFLALQQGLNEVEKEIQIARNRFNTAVRRNNTLIQSFPSNFIARYFNFYTAEYFSLELATQRVMPEVQDP